MKGMLQEFKAFAVRGNVVDMAVGIIIGAAFGKIVSSAVADIVMPPLGLLVGGMDFSDLAITLRAATDAAPAVTLGYGKFIQARRMVLKADDGSDVDIGFVGEIEHIDAEIIQLLDSRDFIPVVAPIGVGRDGEAYNINADLVAGKLAETLRAEKLVLMTNTVGVLDRHGKLLTGLSASEIDALFADGTISGGMLPKISGALDAARQGVNAVHIIDGRVPHSMLLEILTDQAYGALLRIERAD